MSDVEAAVFFYSYTNMLLPSLVISSSPYGISAPINNLI